MKNTPISTRRALHRILGSPTAFVIGAGLAAFAFTGCDKTTASMPATDGKPAPVATTQASLDIAAYKLRPTDTNKEEATIALKALAAEITGLKARAAALPSGERRAAAEARIARLEERKSTLDREFNKARFDALIDEVKAEWATPTS